MYKLHKNQGGFIPMIVCLVLLIVPVLYLSFRHVSQDQH